MRRNARWNLLAVAVGIAAFASGCGGNSGEADDGVPGDVPDAWSDVVGVDAIDDPGTRPDDGDIPGDVDTDGDATGPNDLGAEDTADATEAEPWEFHRDAYEPVRGWILLDSDPEKVMEAIENAPNFGVNHIQLSHDLVMNFDDLLGDDAATATRVQTLNDAIVAAHAHDMEAFIWVHEFSETGLDVCYGPDGDVWTSRAAAWNAALDRVPDLDGVVLMFGSAPMSPWFTACSCAWCLDQWESPFEAPPNDQRIQLVTEHLGQVLAVRGKKMVARVFVHEEAELAWHADGFAAAQGVEFVGMHKSDVGDWQPYNPNDPTVGHVGPHPSILELDVGGEYYGASRLPFCSPGYFRYRMQHAWENRGIGYVVRIERGSNRSLGTPNEVNLRELASFVMDPETPLKAVWDKFLYDRYDLVAGSEGATLLRRLLEDSFPIRLKSHYALGIWALEKGTDIPSSAEFGELFNRGAMPKWDPAWQAVYDRVTSPDRDTVLDLWQEGSEAVDLARQDLDAFEAGMLEVVETFQAEDVDDLRYRLTHQWYASRTWRAIDLFLWSQRARMMAGAAPDADLAPWAAWAREELAAVRQGMIDDGLGSATPAGPSRIQSFLDATADSVPEGTVAAEPPAAVIGPARVELLEDGRARVKFEVRGEGVTNVRFLWGKELPDLDHEQALGAVTPDEPVSVYVGDAAASTDAEADVGALDPSSRYLVRVVVTAPGGNGADRTWMGGEWWVFTPPPCHCDEGLGCVEGVCVEASSPPVR